MSKTSRQFSAVKTIALPITIGKSKVRSTTMYLLDLKIIF
jgi:hypothetical protein